ncbi:MAG: chalcone isomerase family protein [Nitrospira sp.]|nr:chalcone isomerase family protein [Nitrospira sp.]
MKPGDRYGLTYLPGVGTELALNGERKGIVEGADFAAAYFAIWLGPDPINEALKEGLTWTGGRTSAGDDGGAERIRPSGSFVEEQERSPLSCNRLSNDSNRSTADRRVCSLGLLNELYSDDIEFQDPFHRIDGPPPCANICQRSTRRWRPVHSGSRTMSGKAIVPY